MPRRFVPGLERAGLQATRALSVLGLTALMLLAAMTLADGLLRWLFSAPIRGVRDVGALAIALSVACCLPVGLMERRNITLKLFAALFGRVAGQLMDALASILVGAAMLLLAREFWVFAGKLARVGETTWILQIPVAPFWYGVAAILWIGVAVQVIVIIVDFARLFGLHPAEGDDDGNLAGERP
ncbi:MAG: TRAP transporter small permease subunit [Rhodobacteraceae bacterium]|nr:TRAP transporter small permease subunit [Paracoccaceae bacterium]